MLRARTRLEDRRPKDRPRRPLNLGKSFLRLGSPLPAVSWAWPHPGSSAYEIFPQALGRLEDPLDSRRPTGSRGSQPQDGSGGVVQLAPGSGRLLPLLGWGSVPPIPAASVRTTPSPGQGAPTGSSEAEGCQAGPGLCHAVSARRRGPPTLARQAACPAGEACGGPTRFCPAPTLAQAWSLLLGLGRHSSSSAVGLLPVGRWVGFQGCRS